MLASPSRCRRRFRQAVLERIFHRGDEGIDLFERRVDIRRHTQALIVVHLRWRLSPDETDDDDSVLVHQELRERTCVDAVDANGRQAPRLTWFQARMDAT